MATPCGSRLGSHLRNQPEMTAGYPRARRMYQVGCPSTTVHTWLRVCGRVEAVGEGGDSAWIGRRVNTFGCWGGCADYAVAPATALNPVPEALDGPTAAAFFTTTCTSWHLVHTAGRVQRGQTVVVHSAAGAVGVMLTQILKEAGAHVIGLTSRREKAEWAKGYGADQWIVTSDEPYHGAVKRLTLCAQSVRRRHGSECTAVQRPATRRFCLGSADAREAQCRHRGEL